MSILKYFPRSVAEALENTDISEAYEIRMRAGRPLCIRYPSGVRTLDIIITPQLLSETLQRVCGYSLYAYANDIARGFVTADGARVGIGGRVIFDGGESRGIKTVSSLNIRAARQIKGCADSLMPYIFDGKIHNTMIVSPPLCGKTTLLRDIARQLGDADINVSLIDERSETASLDTNGIPQFDVGKCTDVLGGCSKPVGIMMALRSLAPQVIALDEIGENEDVQAINRALTGGAAVICTVHSDSYKGLKNKKYIRPLLVDRLFERIIILKAPGKTADVLDEKGESLWQGPRQ